MNKSRQLDQKEAMEEHMREIREGELSEEMLHHNALHADSDSEVDDDIEEAKKETEKRRQRRKGKSRNLQGMYLYNGYL